MKRLLTIIFVLLFACGAMAGQVSDELDQIENSKWQSERAIHARAQLEYAHRVLNEVNVAVQKVVDENNLDLIPDTTKQALNRAWQIYKQAIAALEADPEIMEAFEWRPSR